MFSFFGPRVFTFLSYAYCSVTFSYMSLRATRVRLMQIIIRQHPALYGLIAKERFFYSIIDYSQILLVFFQTFLSYELILKKLTYTKGSDLYKTPKRRRVLHWTEAVRGPFGECETYQPMKTSVRGGVAESPIKHRVAFASGVFFGASNGVTDWPSDSMGQWVRCFDFKSATVADFNQINRPLGILIGLWPMADANLKPWRVLYIYGFGI